MERDRKKPLTRADWAKRELSREEEKDVEDLIAALNAPAAFIGVGGDRG